MKSHLVDWLTPLVGRDWATFLAPSWFACIGLAWIIVCVWVLRSARRRGDHIPSVASALAAVYASALIAGIALPALAAAVESVSRGDGFRLRWAGMTSYAGYGAGVVVLYLVLRKNQRLGPARFADLLAAPIGIGLCIGRLGCFLAGCDYGQVTSSPWAVRFPAGSSAWRDHVASGWLPADRARSLPVHPTQLYEAMLGLALCALAIAVARTAWARQRDGRVFAAVVVGYSAGRIMIENVRGDLGSAVVGPWSGAQIAFALLLAAMAVMTARRHSRALSAAGAAIVLLVSTGRAQAQPEATVEAERRSLRLSGFLAGAAPLNRRDQQVPAMGGGGITAGLDLGSIALELDLTSVANTVAAHQSALLAFGLHHGLGDRISVGGRVGLGVTLVNFDDPAFSDVVSADLRIGSEVELALSDHVALTLRPIELDLIGDRSLGGPIVSYQIQLGVTLRLGRERAEPAPASAPAPMIDPGPYPGPYPPPSPMPSPGSPLPPGTPGPSPLPPAPVPAPAPPAPPPS